MSQLEEVNRENWEEFLGAPMAVLMLGKSDCQACQAWTLELNEFLANDDQFSDVRFGKLLLDQGGMGAFKKASPWLANVNDLPHNAIYVNGEKVKDFIGSGVERLTNRLNRLKSDE